MGALLALTLLAAVTLTNDQKTAWALAHCDGVAADAGYHACAVELSDDGERMWLHYGCDTWDAEREEWITELSLVVVPYRWTDDGLVEQLDAPVMLGCPEYL